MGSDMNHRNANLLLTGLGMAGVAAVLLLAVA